MNITIVERGSLGLQLARALSLRHFVYLLRNREDSTDDTSEVSANRTSTDMARAVHPPANGLVVTDAIDLAFSYADHIIVTPPIEYDGVHARYNALLCEATLQDVLMHNATASVALQTLVPPGFSDRVAREFGARRLLHVFMTPDSVVYDSLGAGNRLVVIGGPQPEAVFHTTLLQQAQGAPLSTVLVDRKTSECAALIANQLDLASPDAIERVTENAEQYGLDAGVMVECLGLRSLKPNEGTGPSLTKHVRHPPQDGASAHAC